MEFDKAIAEELRELAVKYDLAILTGIQVIPPIAPLINKKPGGNVLAKAIQKQKSKTPWFSRSPQEQQESEPPQAIPVEEDPNKGTGTANFCEPDIVSKCSVKKKNWPGPKVCKHAYKACHAERCMYLTFDEFCTCLDAQKNS